VRGANLLIAIGVGLVVVGVALRYFPGLFSWFGNLPGDIKRETENATIFIPITSTLVVSVVASLILSLVSRLFRGE
jgi:multisubunit Na+/H+ antiporter MnhB subunit